MAGSVPMRKFRRWAKTRQPFSAVSGPKFTKFGGMQASPCRLTSFFMIVDIMFLLQIYFWSKFKVGPQKAFPPGGVWTNFVK